MQLSELFKILHTILNFRLKIHALRYSDGTDKKASFSSSIPLK